MKYYFTCIVFVILALQTRAQQLVMRGDHADPSVVKIGDAYWASATTSNWLPAYPLLQSKDLVNWNTQGYVFTVPPTWADYYFWAPEITYENGKVYIYYAAHKKRGNLCLAVASADKPEGPYTDHGPIMCQDAGSIDAFPMRDENGKLYIIWKEDGNSVNKPTPIWAQEMNETRTALVGEKKELFRNDKPWEGNLVEGVSMIKKGDYYYAFYAGAGCCGSKCNYQTGIARSKTLLGPWEKYNSNPILADDRDWKCPGHGTPIEKEGRYYFLYHAYDKETDVYTGREGLLIEFRFTPDGWIEFVRDTAADVPALDIKEDFSGAQLSHGWQWSVFQPAQFTQNNGRLELMAAPTPSGAYLGTITTSGNYTASVEVDGKNSTAAAGLALVGDDKNTVSAVITNGLVQVVQLKNGKELVLSQLPVQRHKKHKLQMTVAGGKEISFFYGRKGKALKMINPMPADGSFLPPWDRSLRVGLVAKGDYNRKVIFDNFQLSNQ